jgi:hypothetical protein
MDPILYNVINELHYVMDSVRSTFLGSRGLVEAKLRVKVEVGEIVDIGKPAIRANTRITSVIPILANEQILDLMVTISKVVASSIAEMLRDIGFAETIIIMTHNPTVVNTPTATITLSIQYDIIKMSKMGVEEGELTVRLINIEAR